MRVDLLGGRISRRSWYSILGLAWILHNIEEVLLAPQMLRFMQSDAPGFLRHAYAGITVPELRAVLLLLTAALLIVIAIAAAFPNTAASAFGLIMFTALLGLNAVFHIGLFMQTGVYAAGLATAVLLSLPVTAALLAQAKQQRWIASRAFWTALPAAILIHGPVLDGLFKASLSTVRG
jgi:hypothetical protein